MFMRLLMRRKKQIKEMFSMTYIYMLISYFVKNGEGRKRKDRDESLKSL